MGFADDQIATATEGGRPLSAPVEFGIMVDDGEEITIIMHARPIGKPRQTQRDKWAKRPAVLRYRDWADKLRSIARNLPQPEQITDLSWTAYFEPPKSWPKRKRFEAIGTIHRQKPDRDNIDKAVLDALFERDEAIGVGTLKKYWGIEDGLTVTISYTGENEP